MHLLLVTCLNLNFAPGPQRSCEGGEAAGSLFDLLPSGAILNKSLFLAPHCYMSV